MKPISEAKNCIRRNICRRIAALFIAAACAFALLPPAAFAAGGSTGDLSWSLINGTLTISGKGRMPDYSDSVMPPWAEISDAINRIVVSEGVTSIGSLAFYNCSEAKFAFLPSTVTSIGDRAFKFCRSLSYLSLPSGLLSIGEAAFESCENINGIILPDGLNYIGNYAFDRCSSLTLITIPASVTHMGSVLFHCCTSLIQVVILAPITALPDCTFYNCNSLSTVSVPETVEEIGEYAFHNCEKLGNVYYTGADSSVITDALESDATVGNETTVIEQKSVGRTDTGNIFVSGNNGTSISAGKTENSFITQTQVTEYEFTVNGEPATYEEVLETSEEDEIEANVSTTTTISAVVHNSDGWSDVARAAESAVKTKHEDSSVEVRVQMEDSVITPRELTKMAGSDVDLTITTSNGSTWNLDQSEHSRDSFNRQTYNLDYSVSKMDNGRKSTGIESDSVYSLNFAGSTDFTATVGVPLKVSEARKTATLYEKHGNEYNAVQNVVVDDSGTAWFQLASTDEKTDYFVAVNAAGVDHSEAIVPTTLSKDYNINSTLVGADGKQYEITGRTSRWGITGAEYMIYVAIAVGFVVLLITLIMVTMNRISKSRAKMIAEAEAKESSKDLDEEELRLEIMRELLEEQEKSNKQ